MVAFNEIYSLINTAGTTYQAFESGSAEAKVNSAFKLGASLFNLISNELNKVQGAEKETAENEGRAQDYEAKSSEIRGLTYKRAEKKIEEIQENIAEISAIMEVLDKNAQAVIDYNKQLEDQKAIINKAQETVEDPSVSGKERREALKQISAAGAVILDLYSEVSKYAEANESISGQIEELTENNEALSTEGNDIIAEGTQQSQEVLAQASADAATTLPKTTATGTKDIATGEAQIASGTPMLATPATAAAGQALIDQGRKSVTAGGIRTTKSAFTMGNLGRTIGGIGTSLSEFANFGTALGSAYNSGLDLIDKTSIIWQPLVTSVGSWQNVGKSAENIVATADEAASQIDTSEEEGEAGTEVTKKLFDTEELVVEEISV